MIDTGVLNERVLAIARGHGARNRGAGLPEWDVKQGTLDWLTRYAVQEFQAEALRGWREANERINLEESRGTQ